MKVFVIDFSKESSLLGICSQNGNVVESEQMDGALAYRKSAEFMPDIIVVNYAAKPSHGRLTAKKIKERKRTSAIPVYFVDGDEKEKLKIAAIGKAISSQDFNKLMKNS